MSTAIRHLTSLSDSATIIPDPANGLPRSEIMTKILGLPLCAIMICGLAAGMPLPASQALAPKAFPPVLVTSCGQSQGPEMLNIILRRVGVAYDIVPVAAAKDLKAKPYKTLIVTMGASLKGMGAAGVSIEDELKRIADLIDAAKKEKITIIGAHIEGMKRRAQGAEAGDTTDEQSIDAVGPKSDILFVHMDGNTDGRFTAIAQQKKIPLIEFAKNLDMVAELTKVFK
jgi:hypothetical protein